MYNDKKQGQSDPGQIVVSNSNTTLTDCSETELGWGPRNVGIPVIRIRTGSGSGLGLTRARAHEFEQPAHARLC